MTEIKFNEQGIYISENYGCMNKPKKGKTVLLITPHITRGTVEIEIGEGAFPVKDANKILKIFGFKIIK